MKRLKFKFMRKWMLSGHVRRTLMTTDLVLHKLTFLVIDLVIVIVIFSCIFKKTVVLCLTMQPQSHTIFANILE